MELLFYIAPPELAGVAAKAADVWNEVLRDLAALRPWSAQSASVSSSSWTAQPDVSIAWRTDVKTRARPDRVAYCQRVGPSRWVIAMDQTSKWAISPLARFFGKGEDALACLVHEMGHVLQMPHATDPNFVMHSEIGGSGRLSRREKELYRASFLRVLEGEK